MMDLEELKRIVLQGKPIEDVLEKFDWKEFSPRKRISDVNHIVLETIRAKTQNNVLERYHGTFREFDKIKRGFKGQEKALTDGFITYYNFIRKHMSLNGLTPSQMAGIELNLGRNRWLSLLRQSLGKRN